MHNLKPLQLLQLLSEYADVFAEPQELPPSRAYDHAIQLKPDAAPFNARPYRYSPEHKTEIEQHVRKMLPAGFITQSMLPFASPVLLVLLVLKKRWLVEILYLLSTP
jgi:hypothetical protein